MILKRLKVQTTLGEATNCYIVEDEETKENLTATEIARDGIAVVVNNDNDIDELTSDQVKSIFTGETTVWADVQ